MPRYFYNGTSLDGQKTSGFLLANDQSQLEISLVDLGVSLDSARPEFGYWEGLRINLFRKGEITRITRQIQLLLESGITAVEAFELAADQLKDKTLKQIFENVISNVISGRSLAESLSDYKIVFDELYISMVSAGELSGDLDKAFDRIASFREKSETLTRKVRSALAYPALVTLVAIMVVMVLVFYVVPIFSSMYDNFGAELPALTAHVVNTATFIRETILWWAIGGIMFLLGMGIAVRTERVTYQIHRSLLYVPALRTLLIKILAARFSRTMGSLLTSGVEIIQALGIAVKTTGNKHMQKRLEPVQLRIAQGVSFTEALEEASLLPTALLRMSASGEKTGRLGEMLSKAADYYEKETDSAVSTLTSLIEPVVIIVLGVLIAFILIAMYLPLFDLVGAV